MGTACLCTKIPSKMVEVLQWILGALTPSASTPTSLSRFGTQGPGWHTVCAGFGASPKRALQRPALQSNTPSSARLIQAPSTAKRASRPASGHLCSRTPPHHPQFRPARGRGRPDSPKPSVPSAPRHSRRDCQPSRGKHTAWPDLTRCSRLPKWLHNTLNGSGHRSVHTPPHCHRSPTSPEHTAGTNTIPTAPRPRRHPKSQ